MLEHFGRTLVKHRAATHGGAHCIGRALRRIRRRSIGAVDHHRIQPGRLVPAQAHHFIAVVGHLQVGHRCDQAHPLDGKDVGRLRRHAIGDVDRGLRFAQIRGRIYHGERRDFARRHRRIRLRQQGKISRTGTTDGDLAQR